MDRLWSPWRSSHIESFKGSRTSDGPEGSLFSRLLAEDRDEDNLILWRGRHVFVIMNLYPYNNGHLMIVPTREVEHYEDLRAEEHVAVAETIAWCIRWIRHALEPEGFNVGMNLGQAAGAGIPRHLHVHVVPRWNGDTNFMPTVGDVKVIPEALRDTFRKLQKAVSELPPS
jgi:ATP adenylyltransferase